MKPPVLVLGSGPIRIGQGIEFDYSCVHSVWALQQMGYRAIIINNNPETVSTDFDTGDALYFEPVTLDDVLRVVHHEQPIGVVCQFGGQTAINLAQELHAAGVAVLGTQPDAIAAAEDRNEFDALLTELGIEKPPGRAVLSVEGALESAAEVGYPVLVRPSFVLGGRAMEICYTEQQLRAYYALAEEANPGRPVLVDKYVQGIEAEVDVISDGADTLVPGIMQHIERAGVHSGDSMAVHPPTTIPDRQLGRMVEIACGIARKLKIRGLMNIQFVLQDDEVYVIEVNPRASRTVPYLSKVTGIPIVQLATRTMMGQTLAEMGYTSGLWCADRTLELTTAWQAAESADFAPRVGGRIFTADEVRDGTAAKPDFFAVKAPVFSFQKLARVEPSLGPEMKSTGEILGVDFDYAAALYKAMVASGITFRNKGNVVISVNRFDKEPAVEIARRLVEEGYPISATDGTHEAITAAGIPCQRVAKIHESEDNLLSMIVAGNVALMINTPNVGEQSTDDAKRIRRACIEAGVACVTNIDTALALSEALTHFNDRNAIECLPITDYLRAKRPVHSVVS